MKINFFIFVIFALLSLSFAFEKLPDEDEQKIVESYFQNFPNTRGGRSGNAEEAKKNIIKRFYEVQDHNERYRSGKETFEMELNELSASSDKVLSESYLGFVDQPEDDTTPVENNTIAQDFIANSRQGRASIPDYWNWAEKGVVQPVQNQGGCGSCYAFAAIGVIESSMCRYFGRCVKLSEQEAMECTNGCNGGWDTWVYTYSYNYRGVALSSSYGYYGYVRGQCSASSRARAPNSQVTSYSLLPNNAEGIRQFLYSYGPLFVAFDVYNSFFSYRSGIITSISGGYAGGHAVILVGYGTENGVPYWIVKNSWGTGWGERGYFRVKRGINYGRIESWKVTFPFVK